MTVSLTHSTPADGTFSATGATAWDAQHVLTQDTARLLGRTTAGVGATEEISVGTGLSLSGGTLTNTVTATAPGGSDTQIQYNNAGAFGGASGLTTNGTNLTLGSASQLLWSTDLILSRRAAANLRLGAADAAAPVAQTLSVQSVVAGTTNTAGTNLIITGSQGTGTGAGGSIIFQVAPASPTSNAVQNALVDALTLSAVTGGGRLTLTSNSTTAFIETLGAGVDGININNRACIGSTDASFTFYVASTSSIGWSSNTNVTASVSDTRLWRDAIYTVAQRNGNNGQTFRLYGRFTDITNDFERFFINAPTTSGAAVLLGTQKGATTGAARALEFQTDGTTRLTIATGGGATFTGSVTAVNWTGSGDVQAGATKFLFWNARSSLDSPADGNIRLANNATNDFGRLQFGGTTSSFPALKRSTTFLQARLADDSAFAGFASANMQAATAYTVATLPGTPGTGMIARVTDALAPTIGMTVAAGGAAYALVNYNGANWTVIGV